MGLRSVDVVVKAVVQGEYVDAAVVRAARAMGLVGRVRCTLQGELWVEAEGEEKALKRLVALISGLAQQREERFVEVRWRSYRGKYTGFRWSETTDEA